MTTPSGKQVVYAYANNRPVSVTVDGTNVLNSAVYEPFGPSGGWYWGNSAPPVINTHTRLFDKDFRVTRVTSDLPTTGSQPVFDKQLTWDDQGRVQALSDLANSALNATYGFDALDRLASATQGASSWGYTYNGTGDRITSTVNSAITNYGYAAASHKLQALTGAQTRTYAMDAVGNMTSDGTTTWTYGGSNRPTQAGSTTFLVNALGQRVKKASASAITHFVFDEAGRLWGEYDATGNLIQETIWLDDLPVATVTSALNYVHPDHLATPRAITRASDNALLWRWDNTEAFGNSQPDSNPSGLGAFAYNLRFPGQYFDIETGTHYNYRRDYDPRIGRYVESDPIGLRGGLNTYAYVENDTLRKADPTGLFVPPPPGSVAGAAAAQGSAAAAGGIGRGSAGGSALGSALSRALNDAKRGACRTRCYINYEASEAICWAQHGLFGRDVEKYMACVGTAEAILKACLSSCDECYP